MIYINNSSPFYAQIVSVTATSGATQYYISGNSILGNGASNSFRFYSGYRFNFAFANAFQCSAVNTTFIGYVGINTNGTICFYGSNSISDYNNTTGTTATSTMYLLATITYNGSYYTNSGVCSVTNTSSFQYYTLINTSGGYVTTTLFQVQHAAGGYTNIVNGTDYNITTNTAKGAPVITYIDSTTQNFNV